jgi:hypothetical protein
MRPARDGGSRFGIVLNGSSLFTGGAGSGESEIRRYVLENDLVEAIIGLLLNKLSSLHTSTPKPPNSTPSLPKPSAPSTSSRNAAPR